MKAEAIAPPLRRPDGTIDTEPYMREARALRWRALRGVFAALYKPQTSEIIGTAVPMTSSVSGKPSRQ